MNYKRAILRANY